MKVSFRLDEAQKAGDEWGFNCGPAALCAMTDLKPNEIRPYLGDFEEKKYTNPRLMEYILEELLIEFKWNTGKHQYEEWPDLSLIRIHWDGPWKHWYEKERNTHWIAKNGKMIFDINAMCVGGYIPYKEWSEQLVPWLIKEAVPRANGNWWTTHVIEIMNGGKSNV